MLGVYINKEAQEAVEIVQNIVLDEIDNMETQQSDVEKKENKSTTIIEDLTAKDEEALEEQETEDEAFELQGNIAYDGDRARTWNIELRRLCRAYIL